MIPRGSETRFDPPPKLVLFDLDNTLCDYEGARLVRTRHAFAPWFDDEALLERVARDALARASEGTDHFTLVLAEHGVVDPEQLAIARSRYGEDRYRGLELFSEALRVVARVAGVAAVGLITNGPSDIQWPKIELLRIAAHFPVIVVSGDVGVWKPDPAIFQIALERTGIAPHDAIYVGDSATHDVPGARAAGLRAVWINRRATAWPGGDPPDAEIRDLDELLPLIGLDDE